MNILGVFLVLIYNFVLLLTAPYIGRNNKELSRKYVHILCAGDWIIGNTFFNNIYYATIPPIVMIALMIISSKFNIFKSIERNNQNKSFGTVYFFVSMLILLIVSFEIYQSMIPLGSYFMLLCFGDGFAALIGKKLNWFTYGVFKHQKSISGSLAMLFFSILSFSIYTFFYDLKYTLMDVLFISFIATVFEGISFKGTDNLTVPLLTYIIFNITRR